MNRRHFIKTSASVAALGMSLQGLSSIVRAADDAKKIPIAVQVYSVREQAAKDVGAMLKAIGDIGYKGVEYAGYYGKKAEELRKMMDDNGLVCCGTHTGLDTLLGDEFKKTVEYNKILGNKFLIVPAGLEHALETRDGALMTAHLMNELADKAAEHEMFVGYHAHSGDVKQIDDTTPWDRFFSQTKKTVVMQVDTGNCLGGGADPVELVKRYPGRATTVHLKTFGGNRNTVIGDDDVKWRDFFDACETVGETEWYIVEHETGTNPVESIKGCFEGLKKLAKCNCLPLLMVSVHLSCGKNTRRW